MRKILFGILMLALVAASSPALAEWEDNTFLAAIMRFVENLMPGEEMQEPLLPEEEWLEEEFVDPREVKQVLREIKDIKRELNRMLKLAKKIPNLADLLNEINALLEQVNSFASNINTGVNLRDAIREFHDAQIWEQLNVIRAKIEIPKEITRWNKEIKKIERLLTQKKYQNLGLDLGGVRAKIEETKASLAMVQEYYNAGDFESAMEEFDNLRQDFYPGEIVSVIQRMQNLMNMLKRVKNAEIREQIKETFGEVISNFNEGEYRVARELMDENFNEITALISKALSVGKKKGVSREGFFQMTDKLEEKLKGKAEEKKLKIQEMREEREEMSQPPKEQMLPPSPPPEAIPPVQP